MKKEFDIIVIGGGHAGAESANAIAKLNKEVLLLSLSLDCIAMLACNPNIGGTAKGHLVREVDALGGLIGEVADIATIQSRTLNLSSGYAVQSLRAQVDKELYRRTMKKRLELTKHISVHQAEAIEILSISENGETRVTGVKTALGQTFFAKAVVLASGVFLNSKIITGEYQKEAGPSGFMRSEALTDSLKKLGLSVRRFKTGTPMRVQGTSINFADLVPQVGDIGNPNFSFLTEFQPRNDYKCFLSYTTEATHKIILNNLDKAPMYNGLISGTGPRYCPSIEDKVVRFKDKDKHQIFLEPEGADTDEYYVQGLSTSLPYDIQEQMLRTVKGLENAVITRYGYAIEYDCVDPLCLYPTLEVKNIKGLFLAGQVNGSSGYEEASAQGFVAGVNAVRSIEGKKGIVMRRDQSYIGVLIDDLVTKGTNEPYRMMTSRAEHRLHLRQDNADLRLTELGREIGTVCDRRYALFQEKLKQIKIAEKLLSKSYSPTAVSDFCLSFNENPPKGGVSIRTLLKRAGITAEAVRERFPELQEVSPEILKHLEIEIKYEGYLLKEQENILSMVKMESAPLPQGLDFSQIHGLRKEASEKLNKVKPLTLAQASRISGVTPADITVVAIFLRTQK
ncbi:MAG: tRNA uridine-5-carboxymethylaminomethyl(34) synthesis enzyme MnmG [Firmicutes bacterium]|nr:tRNA uridine-5-carboxymethylaminomethyl(34) synthesis enzyme MnmG [Bacillota bacterium]